MKISTPATDVFVVGGGPAGLAAAIAARQRGLRVTVADCAIPPIDKACGEGLMPDGLEALGALGVVAPSAESFPFHGIRFIEGAMSAEACFPNGIALGIRRTTLHHLMVNAAAQAGVSMLWGRRVTAVGSRGVSMDDETVPCRWIIGADGGGSRVRKWAGLDTAAYLSRFGFRRHFRIAPWSDFMEIYWANGFQIYVTPIRHDEICVALIALDQHLRLDQALAAMPGLQARLRDAELIGNERGAVSVSRRLRAVSRDNIVLVGDASGSVDAITGEGLCLSFRQSFVLADALVSGDLARYEEEHKRIASGPAKMASLMLSIGNRLKLRRRALRALASDPGIFAQMLALHVGKPSPARFAAAGAALGIRMLMN